MFIKFKFLTLLQVQEPSFIALFSLYTKNLLGTKGYGGNMLKTTLSLGYSASSC